MATNRKQIVILGGGSGGVVAATKLARELGERHDIVLVDRRPVHVFMPGFLFLLVGERESDDITRRLRRLERHGIKVVQDEILGIDPARQQVALAGGRIPYDYLIVALGFETRPEMIPGYAEGAHHAWELEAAMKARAALAAFNGGRVLVGVPLGPYRCPPAPYETQWMLDGYFKKRGIRDRVTIEYFTREAEPSGDARDPVVWMDAESRRRDIRQHYEFIAHSIDPEKRTVNGLYGYKLGYDLLFMIPPHRPARALIDSGLADTENGIRVDYDTLATKWDNVYAIGDCADMPASKAGVVAHQEGDVVAHNLAVEITGRGEPAPLRLHTI